MLVLGKGLATARIVPVRTILQMQVSLGSKITPTKTWLRYAEHKLNQRLLKSGRARTSPGHHLTGKQMTRKAVGGLLNVSKVSVSACLQGELRRCKCPFHTCLEATEAKQGLIEYFSYCQLTAADYL